MTPHASPTPSPTIDAHDGGEPAADGHRKAAARTGPLALADVWLRPGVAAAALRALVADRRRWPALGATLLVFLAALIVGLPRGVADERSAAQALPPAVSTASGYAPAELLPVSDADRPAAPTLAADTDFGGMLLDVGSKLLLTIGVLYLTLFLVRKYSARLSGHASGGHLAVVETVRLPQSGAIHIVRVGDRHLLIGATATQISLLGEAGDLASERDRSSTATAESPFLDQLRVAIGAGRDDGSGRPPPA